VYGMSVGPSRHDVHRETQKQRDDDEGNITHLEADRGGSPCSTVLFQVPDQLSRFAF
jgi:hypothetical protein